MTTSTFPRRKGESVADWQQRAAESAGHYWRCLAVTTRGGLCMRARAHCPSHARAEQPA